MNDDGMNLNDLIKLRDTINSKIEKLKNSKHEEVQVGDLYTKYQSDGSKIEYLVVGTDYEYVGELVDDIDIIIYIMFYVDKNGNPYTRGVSRKSYSDFAEKIFTDYVCPTTVIHSNDPCAFEELYVDEVKKLELNLYKKVKGEN